MKRFERRTVSPLLSLALVACVAESTGGCATPLDDTSGELATIEQALVACDGPSPGIPGVCEKLVCTGEREWEIHPKPAGATCPGGSCDGQGACVSGPPPPPPPPPTTPPPTRPVVCFGQPAPLVDVCERAVCSADIHGWEVLPRALGAPCPGNEIGAGSCNGQGQCTAPRWVPAPPSPPRKQWPAQIEVRIHAGSSPQELIQALTAGNRRVILEPNVDMDLGTAHGIGIRPNTTLTGNGARVRDEPGPRLRTNLRTAGVFVIRGDVGDTDDGPLPEEVNVTLEGFRLHGPDFDRDEDHETGTGIEIRAARDVSIQDMDIGGFASTAIVVADDHLLDFNKRPNDVRITDSYIHHNQQHDGGQGYGVKTGAGAMAYVARNVFDFNRHAIASNGEPGTGYTALNNLVLKGGGVHCLDLGFLGSWVCGHTHQFDVHGTGSASCSQGACVCYLGAGSQFKCGPAGERFLISGNSFQYTADHAFDLRGTPSDGAYLYGNTFAHGSVGDAVHQYESGLALGSGQNANKGNVDTFGLYGACDVDGDGRDDLVQASGTAFWYSSAARAPWRFLMPATEQLADIRLGDFDGDGKCDVIAGRPLQISSGFVGEWLPLPGSNDVPISEVRVGHFDGRPTADLFRRDPQGRWLVSAPGGTNAHDWVQIGASSYDLRALRFGRFDADATTDVLVARDGGWSASWGGRSAWAPIGTISSALSDTTVADVNNDGVDDVIRARLQVGAITSGVGGRQYRRIGVLWEVSYGGRSASWQQLYRSPVENVPLGLEPKVFPYLVTVPGHFRGTSTVSLITTSWEREGLVFDRSMSQPAVHSTFAY